MRNIGGDVLCLVCAIASYLQGGVKRSYPVGNRSYLCAWLASSIKQ
ncbi:MAG TPA: hypothetical protein V6D48_24715 [Oculatellaceae cyanobacterium]